MATKQITDLGAAITFDDGDLLLVRKTAEGVDKKIAQADFIKSFGNPAINGFTAASEAANKLTLTASNDVVVDTYYDGMTACFISDIASNGLVQIKVGGLAYKDFIQYGSMQSVILTMNKYLEAIYVGDNATGKWYQTNVVTPTIFTNEYLAAGVVAGDEQSTTYTLNSAIGSTKTVYYDGMSLLFTTNIASKGAVLLNVDGLGLKNLTDQVGDNVSFDLAANETVMAIYNGTNFIKNLFSQVDQPAPPIDPELPVPPENKLDVTVGPAGNFTNITDAIAGLIKSFGTAGGNRLCTINLLANFIWTETVNITEFNLSWITIKSSSIIPVTVPATGTYSSIYVSENTTAPNLEGNFMVTSDLASASNFCKSNGNITINNCVFTSNDTQGNVGPRWFLITKGSLTISNTSISGKYIHFAASDGAKLNFTNLNLSGVSGGGDYISCSGGVNVAIIGLNINNSTGTGKVINLTNAIASFTITDSTIISTVGSQVFNCYNAKNITINNLQLRSSVGFQGLLAQYGAEILVNGGDYRNINNALGSQNILAVGNGSIIRLTNNPLGGTTAVSGGQVIVI